MAEKLFSEAQRKQVFLALVQAQDRKLSVAQSRQEVAGQFGVSEARVQQVEQEGLEKEWPPL